MKYPNPIPTIYAAAIVSLVACGSPTVVPTNPAPSLMEAGPTSTVELADAVFDALARRDKAAFASLFLPDDLAVASCPGPAGQVGEEALLIRLKKERAESERAFEACAASADWRAASQKVVPKSSPLKDIGKCSGLRGWDSLEVSAVIDEKPYMFQLDNPAEVNGRFYLVEDFSCAQERPVLGN